jgi:hypothetical protein
VDRPEKPPSNPVRKDHNRGGRSNWMRNFQVAAAPAIWQTLRQSNSRT